MDSASSNSSKLTEKQVQDLNTEEEAMEINKVLQSDKELSDNTQMQIQEPVADVVEPVQKAPTPTVEKEKPLPRWASKIEGEWVLDAYVLYEKGVELPMEIPIVYEPLELPKTWRFSNGKYKRVMDTDLRLLRDLRW